MNETARAGDVGVAIEPAKGSYATVRIRPEAGTRESLMRRDCKTPKVRAMNAIALAHTTVGLPERIRCVAEPACLPSLLELLDGYCARHEVDAPCRHDLHLIVEEACVNVVSHAYPAGAPGPLTLQVEVDASGGRPAMKITIEDHGKPFNPLALPAPDRSGPLEDLPIGGLGVHLIRQLSDAQHYSRDPQRGNVLTLTKFLAPLAHD